MNNSSFAELNALLLPQAQTILPSWLPDGRFQGPEYVTASTDGGQGRSLSVNTTTGAWSDFATGEKGGDMVSLFAAIHGLSQGGAAKQLAQDLGMDNGKIGARRQVKQQVQEAPKAETWRPILPVPGDAPAPDFNHYKDGLPSRAWPYHDGAGRVLGHVARFDHADGGKDIRPMTYCQGPDGKQEWRWQAFVSPRPLYGLDRLAQEPTAPVLVVEGEKAADAAQVLLPAVVCMTWPGGSNAQGKADFTPLASRRVCVWPDTDSPGIQAALEVAAMARKSGAAEVSIVVPPQDVAQGWDLADAAAKGWTGKQVGEWIKAHRKAPAEFWVEVRERFAPAEPEKRAKFEERAGRALAEVELQSEPIDQAGPVHPIPFDELDLPEIDPTILPSILRDFATALAESIQVPAELTTGMALASIATAAQGKFAVAVRPGYAEPVNIYMVVPLEPGNRKSATVEACKRPLVEFEREARDAAREENRARASERKTLEKAIEARRTKAGTATPENLHVLIEEIKQLEAELPEVPPLPRLLCDDVTPEQLAVLMSEQGGRMGLLEAEGGIFDILAGRYSSGAPNLDLFLKAHNGETVHVDRRNAPSVRLENPCLTIGLSPQPFALTDRQAARAFRSRGLDARFLFLLPQSTVGRRTIEPPAMPPSIQDRYRHKVRSLLSLPWALDQEGREVGHRLRLSGEAYRMWVDFAGDVERELADGGGLELFRDWGGKLAGAAIRLAGLLHVVEHDNPQSREIEAGTMGQAIYLASVLSDHAKGAFILMGSDPSHECAKAALSWIRRERKDSFTARDCYQALKGRYQKMEELQPGLDMLVERGYIFDKSPARAPGKPGRPSQVYEVNPLTFSTEVSR